MSEELPTIAEIVDASHPDVLTWRDSAVGFSQRAKTSCGHDYVHLRDPSGAAHECRGQRVHCSTCALIQSFGEATPGRHRQYREMVQTSAAVTRVLGGMSPLSDHDDEPYGGGV